MISPSPGVMMRSCRILNLEPTPRLRIFDSIIRFDDCIRLFCTSRMHIAKVPGSRRHSSTISSPKKLLLPEPRPPHAPRYLAGFSSGLKTGAVGMRSVVIEKSLLAMRVGPHREGGGDIVEST